MKRIITLLMLIYIVSVPAFGADHYVRDGASGSDDGSDWTNAYTELPEYLTRGDTYYIADGNYPDRDFKDSESGTTYIYILKATSTAHGTDTGWDSAYGDGQAVFDPTSTVNTNLRFWAGYYVFSGVAASDQADSSTYGFKVVNNSGGARWYAIGLPEMGGYNTQLDHITISYTAIPGRNSTYCVANYDDETGIYSYSAEDLTDLTISHNYLSGNSLNLRAQAWASGCVIENNYFDGNWNAGDRHGQQMFVNDTDGVILRNNIFKDSSIYVLGGWTGGNRDWQIYNNLVIGGTLSACWASVQTNVDYDVWERSEIHHNTHINVYFGSRGSVYVGSLTDIPGSRSRAYNNLFINCSHCQMEAGSIGGVVHDYNGYYGCDLTYTPGPNAIDDVIGSQPTYLDDADIATFTGYSDSLELKELLEGVVQDSLGGIARSTDYMDSTLTDPPSIGAFDFGGVGTVIIPTFSVEPDSVGTGTLADIEVAEANAESLSVIKLMDGTHPYDIVLTDNDVGITIESTKTITVENKKTISSFTAPNVASIDTIQADASAEDYTVDIANSSLNAAGTYFLLGYYPGSSHYYNAGLTLPITSAVADNIDSGHVEVYLWEDSLSDGEKAVHRITMQDTAQAVAPTSYAEFMTAVADSISDGETLWTIDNSDSISSWIKKDITDMLKGVPDLGGYDTNNSITFLFLEQNETSSDNPSIYSFDGSSTYAPRLVIYYSSSSGNNSYKILTGNEANSDSLWFDGDSGTKVAWKDSLGLNEWCYSATGDTLYIPELQDDDVIQIDGYGRVIDTNSNDDISLDGSGGTFIVKAYGDTALYDETGTLDATKIIITETSVAFARSLGTLTRPTIDADSLLGYATITNGIIIDPTYISTNITITGTILINGNSITVPDGCTVKTWSFDSDYAPTDADVADKGAVDYTDYVAVITGSHKKRFNLEEKKQFNIKKWNL